MDILQTVILGVVEGVTEFLPVSSTAHLILGSRLLGLTQTEFLKSFEIAVQTGAILSVAVLYGRTVLADVRRLGKIFVAVLPAAVVGLAFYRIVRDVFFENIPLILSALILGGILMILIERRRKNSDGPVQSLDTLSYRHSFLIGLCQAVAVIPGVSRAGATIMGGLLLGVGRKTITEFSFLIAVPTMAGAALLDLSRNSQTVSQELPLFLLGLGVSFVAALLTIRWLVGYVSRHSFVGFGVYRIGAGILFWLIL